MYNKEKETVNAKDCYAVVKKDNEYYCKLKMKDIDIFTDYSKVSVCQCSYFREKKNIATNSNT